MDTPAEPRVEPEKKARRGLLRALGRGIRAGWLYIGATILLLFVFEAGINTLYHWDDFHNHPSRRFEAYRGADWVDAYVREELAVREGWAPFVHWRCEPREGRDLRIGGDGLRRTWTRATPHDPLRRTFRVFVFGGSTTWGTGVRDEYTVPSWLARILSEEYGLDVEVTNFGEIGYVSTQELILLLRQIQQGNLPDLAIFYDGVNDIFSAVQSRQAGLPEHEFNRVREFNVLGRKRKALAALFWGSSQQGLPRFAATLARRLLHAERKPFALPDGLAEDVVRTYAANVKLAEILARASGFPILFYWQPAIYSKASKPPEEQASENRLLFLKEFYLDVYRRVREHPGLAADTAFHDISALLDDRPEACYIDYFHLSEEANGLIARRLAEDARAVLQAPK
ncbi:MAG TPA: GDSL-type esterase/lipase family protein [Kiritimatiellia bacterium]|nr:GDSL-type esterase/lipase family protein [Kiritimatiellia bacterium]HRZ12163.1 GDSL-type esterase/lipase family protein [Kiritimatiellia bacterium]HSA18079.1 GDSL-type esterase/lipase family protein [Kiritimatiellia bacterium]